MIEVNLFGGFDHLHQSNGRYSMTDNRIPKNWKWVRNKMKHPGVTIFTDDYMCNTNLVHSVISDYKIGMIIEPPQINSNVYANLDAIIDNFDLIITYNKNLVDKYPTKIKFYPYGGSWIQEQHIGVYEKTKLVNILLSHKQITDGHRLRHQIVKQFPDVETYGNGSNRSFEYKEEVLAPYMFSIVIENSKIDDYFSEKLLDCFAVGTIPIYWGTNNIGNYFDTDGIISFNSLEELNNILNTLSYDLYQSKLNSIFSNNQLLKKYYCQEDWIYEHILLPMGVRETFEIVDYHPSDIETMVDGYTQQHWLDLFFSAGGDSMLYKFEQLNENSIVFDLGSYKGEFYSNITSMYNCIVHAFEPVEQFYNECKNSLPNNVILNNFALGQQNELFEIAVSENASSQFINGDMVSCKKVNFIDYVTEHTIEHIDLIKLNIEGGEYEVLNSIIDNGYLDNIDSLLIQFHYLSGNPISKRQEIIEKLKITHECIFSYPFVWEYWRRK